MIYFLQRPSGGPIKIGTTFRLSVRIKQLQSQYHTKLVVLGIMKGSYPVEKKLHALFSSIEEDREWFSPTEDLLNFIKRECYEWNQSDDKPEPAPKSEPTSKGKPGRKPLSDSRKTETPLRIRLTDEERDIIDQAAEEDGVPSSTWIRDVGLMAAKEQLTKQKT